MIMENLSNAIEMLKEAMKNEYGENTKLEEGESVIGVFNDAVIIMSLENSELNLDIKMGEPFKFDYNLLEGRDENGGDKFEKK